MCHAARVFAAEPVQYTGQTAEGRRIVIEVRGRAVVHVRAGLERYRCETFEDIGPLVVSRPGLAPLARDGGFRFAAGPAAQRLTVLGHVRTGGRITGTVRVKGTIATGQACTSLTVRFRAHR